MLLLKLLTPPPDILHDGANNRSNRYPHLYTSRGDIELGLLVIVLLREISCLLGLHPGMVLSPAYSATTRISKIDIKQVQVLYLPEREHPRR